jgi:hypothetical protein
LGTIRPRRGGASPGAPPRERRRPRVAVQLIATRHRLNLKSTYWFSWKDIQGDCNFCDSVGLFREGSGFKPKPAWHAFVALTGGRTRP